MLVSLVGIGRYFCGNPAIWAGWPRKPEAEVRKLYHSLGFRTEEYDDPVSSTDVVRKWRLAPGQFVEVTRVEELFELQRRLGVDLVISDDFEGEPVVRIFDDYKMNEGI